MLVKLQKGIQEDLGYNKKRFLVWQPNRFSKVCQLFMTLIFTEVYSIRDHILDENIFLFIEG